jgi:anthranilate phosphoribosyltransferase
VLKPYVKTAVAGDDLDTTDAELAMGIVMRGEATPAQIAAWLVALRLKGETPEEITGFARAMRAAMVTLDQVPLNTVDTCGTGGDGLSTFNISTAAALITAACGVPVAKHGNRAVSSQCGSADVLRELGFEIDPGAEVAARSLRECGFAFLFAPRFHPAMKHAIGPRREIGVRTVFNLLGPICNPANVERQIVGVYDPDWLVPLATVLGSLGAQRALIVAGPHGADELLPAGESRVAEWDGQNVREYAIDPGDTGLARVVLDDIKGSTTEQNAAIIRAIADGKEGPATDTALLNAGAALWIGESAASLGDGIETARDAIKRGRMKDLLKKAADASRGA